MDPTYTSHPHDCICSRCETIAKEEAEARRSAAACSPRESLRVAYSREEMRDASVKWMIEQFGIPKDMADDERDRWHARCGLLYHFIYDHFPAENTKISNG